MKLLVESDKAALARYAHVARVSGSAACGRACPGTERTCTRRRGHGGPHVAHGFLGKVTAAWDSAAETGRKRDTGSAPTLRRRMALRTLRPKAGAVERLVGWIYRVLADPEQLLLLLFFVAFVGFALHWLTLIM